MIDFSFFKWPNDIGQLVDYLKKIADNKYKTFSKSLIPGEFTMIGVNIPTLKKIAKEIYKGNWQDFLSVQDQNIFEIKFLKGQVIANIKDSNEYEKYFWAYLPSITDWSLCDSFILASKVIKKDRKRFLSIVKKLVSEKDQFKNRVGFIIMLGYFIDEKFLGDVLTIIDGYESDEYYANMGLAWLLSVMYIKFPLETFEFMKNANLSREVITYTIRKVRDSYRVTAENKERILDLK